MTAHQDRVEEFMHKAGQVVGERPFIPDEEVRRLRATLILEEALETVAALGFDIKVESSLTSPFIPVCEETAILHINRYRPPDLIEIADGCADLSVVTIGTLSACGIRDESLLEEVDESNLRKFGKGSFRREDGKWLKPPDWQPPDIQRVLDEQGC